MHTTEIHSGDYISWSIWDRSTTTVRVLTVGNRYNPDHISVRCADDVTELFDRGVPEHARPASPAERASFENALAARRAR